MAVQFPAIFSCKLFKMSAIRSTNRVSTDEQQSGRVSERCTTGRRREQGTQVNAGNHEVMISLEANINRRKAFAHYKILLTKAKDQSRNISSISRDVSCFRSIQIRDLPQISRSLSILVAFHDKQEII